MSTTNNNTEEAPSVPKSKRYRRDKPWDDPNVDHWKMQEIKPEQSAPFLQESSFSVLFPQYRQKYIQQCQGIVKKRLMQFGIKFQLNLLEGSMTVRTTKKTWDPYAIIKARDVIKLISRSVPYQQALKVMEDDCFSEIIKIRSYVRNKERFIKRRQRLIGPNGDTLKALQLLTQCYILVQGSTVCIIGKFKQVKVLRRIIVDTMQNIHPIYHIKELMIKRQLMKDEKMKEENWDKFLPKFKQVKIKRKTSKKKGKKQKQYNPFPPEPTPRLEDIQMQTGQYFLSQADKNKRKLELKKKKQEQKKQQKHQKTQVEQEQHELKKQRARQKEKVQQPKVSTKKADPTIDELRQKFLTKPIKKVSFL